MQLDVGWLIETGQDSRKFATDRRAFTTDRLAFSLPDDRRAIVHDEPQLALSAVRIGSALQTSPGPQLAAR